MATSVTVVTTRHEGAAHGFTANSFTSVSSSPPLVAVFLADTAECYPVFEASDRVAINVLADGQGDVARRFATRGADKFGGLALDPFRPQTPVLEEAMSSIVGTVQLRQTAGDHLMLLVAVDEVLHSERPPLVYQNREFRKLV